MIVPALTLTTLISWLIKTGSNVVTQPSTLVIHGMNTEKRDRPTHYQ